MRNVKYALKLIGFKQKINENELEKYASIWNPTKWSYRVREGCPVGWVPAVHAWWKEFMKHVRFKAGTRQRRSVETVAWIKMIDWHLENEMSAKKIDDDETDQLNQKTD